MNLIAEIGWNHMGDIQLAKDMIKRAKMAGATMVKFQYWHEANLKPGPWDTDGRREIYRKAELYLSNVEELYKEAEEEDIEFMVSVFNHKDLSELLNSKILGIDRIKISGLEICNTELLELATANYREIYLSTGTATIGEIVNAVSILQQSGPRRIYLMHCVSAYPCKTKDLNLQKIDLLQRMYVNDTTIEVGYSGHGEGIADAVIATIQHNVGTIEKHFTIDKELPGRDNQFALLPHEMKQLSEIMYHYAPPSNDRLTIDYMKVEEEARKLYRGRWNGR